VVGPGPGNAERTDDCPEAAILAAYDQDELEADEQERIADHIAACAFCQGLLVQARRAESPDDGSSALMEADAYMLASQLASWLSTVPYPSEQEIVAGALEAAYSQAFGPSTDQSQEDGQLVGAGLRFASVGEESLARRIMSACLTIAEIRLSGRTGGSEITSHFRSVSHQLFPNAESSDLVDQVVEWVDAHSIG